MLGGLLPWRRVPTPFSLRPHLWILSSRWQRGRQRRPPGAADQHRYCGMFSSRLPGQNRRGQHGVLRRDKRPLRCGRVRGMLSLSNLCMMAAVSLTTEPVLRPTTCDAKCAIEYESYFHECGAQISASFRPEQQYHFQALHEACSSLPLDSLLQVMSTAECPAGSSGAPPQRHLAKHPARRWCLWQQHFCPGGGTGSSQPPTLVPAAGTQRKKWRQVHCTPTSTCPVPCTRCRFFFC